MLCCLEGSDAKWLSEYAKDFHKRFLSLLGYDFSKFTAMQALNVIESVKKGEELSQSNSTRIMTKQELDLFFTPFDLKRLESYS